MISDRRQDGRQPVVGRTLAAAVGRRRRIALPRILRIGGPTPGIRTVVIAAVAHLLRPWPTLVTGRLTVPSFVIRAHSVAVRAPLRAVRERLVPLGGDAGRAAPSTYDLTR